MANEASTNTTPKRTIQKKGAKALATKKAYEAKRAEIEDEYIFNNPRKGEAFYKKEELFETIVKQVAKLDRSEMFDFAKSIKIGKEFFTCNYCGELKSKKDFYITTEPENRTGVSRICKDCATKVALNINKNGDINPTRESVIRALSLLNKPFYESLWSASLKEYGDETSGLKRGNVWASYIKNVAMKNYYGHTYADGDNVNVSKFKKEKQGSSELDNTMFSDEVIEQFEKNRKETIRLLGYDPFETEEPADKPFMYADLIGFLGSTTDENDDRMRVNSIISIVRSYNQNKKIDDKIAFYNKSEDNIATNAAIVKSLIAQKKQLADLITSYAKESNISSNSSKNATKGEDTWTGKMRIIKEMNLRDAEVNGFDIETCKGMAQVADISHASILKQIKLDESDYTSMLAEQRELLIKAQEKASEYEEKARILLRENLDLKDLLHKNDIDISEYLSRDTILYDCTDDDEVINNE